MIKQYLQVTKPGIIFGNLISVVGGFLLASKGSINYTLFLTSMVGVSLVVASGCVFNNVIDRDIDRKMERTKNRVLVKGLISAKTSLVYATLLGIAGFMMLYFGANPLAMWLSVIGFIVYVGIYSLYMKRHSVYGTLIGSLSGAAPLLSVTVPYRMNLMPEPLSCWLSLASGKCRIPMPLPFTGLKITRPLIFRYYRW